MGVVAVFLTAALLLALERAAYVAAWRWPEAFAEACGRLGGEPVDTLSSLFLVFKAIQASVFLGWCLWWPPSPPPWVHPGAFATGLALVGAGQALNLAVFRRLGRVGVFYGTRFGHEVPWCTGFPFSVVDHPQYIGTVMTIWGFFLLLRYPAPDWIALPLLESVYYAVGARLERHA